jgi:type VI secretion system secreted protein Hcp
MKDIYVKFSKTSTGQSIDGESRDEKHPASAGWFEVSSWQHLIRQPKSATASTAGGHTAERCEHGEMIFTKDIDKVSPRLWEACSAGTTYTDVEIHFMRASGSSRVQYLTIKLHHVIVSSVTPSVMHEGLPTEVFGLKYAAVSWDYKQQGIDGKDIGNSSGKWSLSKNNNTITV